MPNMKKKNVTSALVSQDIDFISESQYMQDSSKQKKVQKRQRTEGDEGIAKFIGQYQSNIKKEKTNATLATCEESRQKLLDVMGHQVEARKIGNTNLLKSLSDILIQLEADYNSMKENEQKLEHLTSAVIKCMQQATLAQKQKLKALKEIHSSFKKESEEMEYNHKAETERFADELVDDIKKLQQNLISETKRNGYEMLRRTIFHVMQNDI